MSNYKSHYRRFLGMASKEELKQKPGPEQQQICIKGLVFTNAYAVEMLYLVQARNLILGHDSPVLRPVKKENIMTEIDNDLSMRSTGIMSGTCVAL